MVPPFDTHCLPPGSRFAELDHIWNAARARNMYQYLAAALGLVTTKVWLNGSSARFCPQRTIACTSAFGGTTIHGCSVGYTHNVTIDAPTLTDVLRACALNSTSASRDCGIARDMERPKVRAWDISAEMVRLF